MDRMLELQELADELAQLALWLHLLTRQEREGSPDQWELIRARVKRTLQRVEEL